MLDPGHDDLGWDPRHDSHNPYRYLIPDGSFCSKPRQDESDPKPSPINCTRFALPWVTFHFRQHKDKVWVKWLIFLFSPHCKNLMKIFQSQKTRQMKWAWNCSVLLVILAKIQIFNSTLFVYFSLFAMRKIFLAVRKISKWFKRD